MVVSCDSGEAYTNSKQKTEDVYYAGTDWLSVKNWAPGDVSAYWEGIYADTIYKQKQTV